jgi:hypothetical protein
MQVASAGQLIVCFCGAPPTSVVVVPGTQIEPAHRVCIVVAETSSTTVEVTVVVIVQYVVTALALQSVEVPTGGIRNCGANISSSRYGGDEGEGGEKAEHCCMY